MNNAQYLIGIAFSLLLLLSGCWVVPTASETNSQRKESLNSLLGSTKEKVIDAWGKPTKEYQKDSESYYLYSKVESWSTLIVFVGPPIPEGMPVASCYLLKFDDNDVFVDFETEADTRYDALRQYGSTASELCKQDVERGSFWMY